jgi:hypothetical protein
MPRQCGDSADQAKPEPEPDDRLACQDAAPESLDELVHIVKQGLDDITRSYIAIGDALAKIRDGKLDRPQTFEHGRRYSDDQWEKLVRISGTAL